MGEESGIWERRDVAVGERVGYGRGGMWQWVREWDMGDRGCGSGWVRRVGYGRGGM